MCTVSGAASPSEVKAAFEELSEATGDAYTLNECDDLLGTLELYESETRDIPGVLTQFEGEIGQLISSMKEESKEEQEAANAALEGDPVRLATGEFLWDSVDISFPYLSEAINITRTYRSGNRSGRSFGMGWTFNFDSRIVRGVKPRTGKNWS